MSPFIDWVSAVVPYVHDETICDGYIIRLDKNGEKQYEKPVFKKVVGLPRGLSPGALLGRRTESLRLGQSHQVPARPQRLRVSRSRGVDGRCARQGGLRLGPTPLPFKKVTAGGQETTV